ncbi:MAG: hypothetical protein V3S69_04715, partial [Dehalococcoidales bacterium]
GFPAVAVSGVDNWRNRNIVLPGDVQLTKDQRTGAIKARIPAGDSNVSVIQDTGVVAVGFHDLVDFLVQQKMEVILVYDTDAKDKPNVQRAAASLGYELRYRGIPIRNIRQLLLPAPKGKKVGLDDYLKKEGTKSFAGLLRICRAKRIAFPRHPNPKTFVGSRLQKSRLTRKETQDVALAILMELEGKGRRLRNKATQELFFFDDQTHTLMPIYIGSTRVMLHETSFGSYLYREFNISATDQRVVGWLATQIYGEEGVEDTETHKVLAKPSDMPNCIAYQLSDSHFIIITPRSEQPYIICENGEHGVLFEQGQVKAISPHDIEAEWSLAIDGDDTMFWEKTLSAFDFVTSEGSDQEKVHMLCALLFYLSPWLLRWKGLQLPVELLVGEPGSGKSSLYELRQIIISGFSRLSNMTNDIKDWYAGITSHGGIHVMDNIHFTGSAKDYQQRLSDEICRLITETKPHVELRKLYTTSDVLQLPVTTTFAFTAIEQPFFTEDLLQRAAVFEVQSIGSNHDADWIGNQLRAGRKRVGWVAHHLVTIHRFLHLAIVKKRWDNQYRAGHRLAHYEQALMLMAEVFGYKGAWIPDALDTQMMIKVGESDWTMSGIGEFILHWHLKNSERKFAMSDITKWADEHDTFHKNSTLTNSWKLSKYFRSHRAALQHSLGIHQDGTKANKQMYKLLEVA